MFIVKVFELAKELNVESKELLEVIQGLDIDVKSHLSNLEDNQVEKIKETIGVNNSANNDSEEKEKSVTPKQKQWKPDLNRMICLKNIASGKFHQ